MDCAIRCTQNIECTAMRYNGCMGTCELGQKRATKPADSNTPESERINIHAAPGDVSYYNKLLALPGFERDFYCQLCISVSALCLSQI